MGAGILKCVAQIIAPLILFFKIATEYFGDEI
jgi:hypothetical protein